LLDWIDNKRYTSVIVNWDSNNRERRAMTTTKRRGHGEGSICQRKDGLWVARITLPRGKRKPFYGKTRREAADKLKEAQKALDEGLSLDGDKQTVAQFLEKWLAASVKPSVKVRTYENYESIVRVRVVPHLGRKQLSKLTSLDVQALYSTLSESGLSNRSVQHTHRVLHLALKQAVKWNMILRNPCDGATAPRPARTEMKVLTPEQARTFLHQTAEHPCHALYVLAITTGMRAGELLGLKWEDIDLEAGKLTIRRALQQQNSSGLVFVTPKTKGSRRTIYLGQLAIAALRIHRDRQTFQRRKAGDAWKELDLVFPTHLGGPMDPSWSRQVFYAALKAAGIPRVRFHDLRHTAATLALKQGMHPKVVSDMLGHGTVGLTLDTYSHLLPGMHQEVATAMDAILAG
jgi:integrase